MGEKIFLWNHKLADELGWVGKSWRWMKMNREFKKNNQARRQKKGDNDINDIIKMFSHW